MNNFFPYSPPNPQRRNELKNMLMASHKKLYETPKVSFMHRFRYLFLVPAYTALVLSVSFGSLVGVKAFSPVANVYGDLYGNTARLGIATKEALATLRLSDSPTLPGLTVEETRTYAQSSTESKEKALLASKMGRTLDENLQGKLIIPSTGNVVVQNDKTLLLRETAPQTVKLTWKEQYLASGALPARYVIERRSDVQSPWQKVATVEEPFYEDHISENPPHIFYKISIMDWQNTPLLYTLEAEIPLTSVLREGTVPTYLPTPEKDTAASVEKSTEKKSTPAPEYDFKDATQPLLDFSLALSAKSQGTSSFSLHWNTPSVQNIKGYNIYRDNIKRNVSLIKSTSFTDTEVTSGKTYQYQIRVVGQDGKEMGKSEKISKILPLIPKGPTNLHSTLSVNKILLTWDKVSVADLKGYRMMRKDLSNGERKEFFSSTTSFEDSSGTSGTSYSYTLTTLLTTGAASTESATSTITLP